MIKCKGCGNPQIPYRGCYYCYPDTYIRLTLAEVFKYINTMSKNSVVIPKKYLDLAKYSTDWHQLNRLFSTFHKDGYKYIHHILLCNNGFTHEPIRQIELTVMQQMAKDMVIAFMEENTYIVVKYYPKLIGLLLRLVGRYDCAKVYTFEVDDIDVEIYKTHKTKWQYLTKLYLQQKIDDLDTLLQGCNRKMSDVVEFTINI